jgi:hypothetical protein
MGRSDDLLFSSFGSDGQEKCTAWGMGLPAEVEGYAFWWVPELGANVGGMDAVVFDPPQGLSLLTLYLATRTEPGQVGNILIEVLKGYDSGPDAKEVAIGPA